MHKKTISLIFIVTIVLSFMQIVIADSLKYENGGVEFWTNTIDGNNLYDSIKDSLPKLPGNIIPTKTKNGYPLNFRLWKQKGLLVYGNYACVKDNNKFKAGTQPSPGVKTSDGYYFGTDLQEGITDRGEWRYHGIDVSGNPFSNINFIDDSSGTKFNEREWVTEPWTYLPASKKPAISTYNDAAHGNKVTPDIQTKTQQWINNSLPDGVPLKSKPADPEVYKYLNILSAPTSMLPGQGRMWHKMDNGSIWYQTLSVPKLTTKQNLPVTAVITPMTALTINDPGPDNDDQPVMLEFLVTATLNDAAEYADPVNKTIYNTREDIKSWKLTFTAPSGAGTATQTQTGISKVNNKGSYTFTINTTYGYLRSKNWTLHLTATGQPLNQNNTWGNIDNASYVYTIGVQLPPLPEPDAVLINFTPESIIPEIAFDGLPFSASDNTDMSGVTARRVYVNGVQVDGNAFFSGSYLLDVGDVGENGVFAFVDVEYDVKNAPPEGRLGTHDVIYIYPTRPIANFQITSDTWKQNRKIKVQDTSNAGNIQLVIQNYPIVQYEWTFGGDTSQIKFGTNTTSLKEFICKTPGIYSLTLRCKNTLGKWSDAYTVEFEVLEDIAPAIGLNLTDSVTGRNEALKAWYYDVCSTDGDVIKSSGIELWYDANNDGTLETKLNTWDGSGEFPVYTPTKLGHYKYIVKAQEDITSDTFTQFITEQDKKSSAYEVEWWVDNYRPMSDLYVNIPIQRPVIDVYFMLDKNLNQTSTDYINSNKMNISNWLIGKNIIPNVEIWDMKTYTYSQPASTSKHTGSSYPAATISYTGNGYSGTLSRTSVSNNQYSRDEGQYTTQTESKTFTKTVTNTRSWTKNIWGIKYGTWSHSDYGSTYAIDQDGYSGTIPSIGVTYNPSNFSAYKIGDSGTQTATKTFSGTLTKQVQVWVADIVWYNDYTGYYSGTIYKYVRQPHTDPFNPTSIKYVVYISDSTVSELSDLQMVMGYAPSAKLLLTGTSGIASQIANEKYFNVSGKTIDAVADEILEYISISCPAMEKYYVLQNQAFTLNVGNLDLEGDTITTQEMQYVRKPNYFDNPTGTEQGTFTAYSDSSGWTSTIKGSFANTGLFEIYRRIKDSPSTDPNFSQYAYYSGSTRLEIYVHRKPIALAVLDWDFDITNGVYITSWTDNSYDPDHQYNRPDKGIVERNIMWRASGGTWNYGIPDKLTSGTYELQYYVKDPEGEWSDPYAMNFTLSPSPPMQFDTSLRTFNSSFSLVSVPAAEYLEAFNLWTRYPYNVSIEMALYSGAARVTTLRTINYSTSTGTKTGNDINWNNISYQIPATLADRAYTCRISAKGDFLQTAEKSFNINVSTPVDLVPDMPVKAVNGSTCNIAAATAKYVNSTMVTLFYGTSYQTTLTMSGQQSDNGKNWTVNCTIPANIPAGAYTARFQASTPNGNVEYENVAFDVESFIITGVTIDGSWNHWRGQTDIFGTQLSIEPHRFLSLEKVKINVNTTGYAERVIIRFDPQLEAMKFTDIYGNSYEYFDYLGYDIAFPQDSSFELDSSRMDGNAYWEYSLPLAPSSKSWENVRLRPQYKMTVTAFKGAESLTYVVNDIDITGNIYDLTYIQPLN